MADDLPSRVAVLEANQTSHERYCNERAERTANDISGIRRVTEEQAVEARNMAGRIHGRMDEISTAVTKAASTVEGVVEALEKLPTQLTEQMTVKIQVASQASKLETYAQYGAFVMAAVAIIGLAIDYFGGK